MNQTQQEIRVIFWDWNGTLLDDVRVCMAAMNEMLSRRQKPLLTLEHYREVFTFPVIEYYRKIGWDLEVESWDSLAFEFIDLYLKDLPRAPLHRNARASLNYLADKGYRQVILSAMEQNALSNSVRQKGIHPFFDRIAGIDDHFAYSKVKIAQKAIRELDVSPAEVCLIGDTLHDLEVANQMDCKCILVAAGHQSLHRLAQRHNRVINDLSELRDCFD
ncbi:MAG: HAD family hydrolase [Bacteroidales bacterium]|nr:HAD family hydrolase [Lentimicrobiaceae bacterium]MDD5696235.1 HAD family hydrolase [Bacteroidales bacterium]